MNRKNQLTTAAIFLTAELVAYYLILTAGGDLLIQSSFFAIVGCFIYALLHVKKDSLLVTGGLACTVLADFCLVVCDPIRQLWGMVFFLGAQSLYAARLHRVSGSRNFLILRLALSAVAELITVAVLREKTDPLALVSMCYYMNLILNIVQAFTLRRKNALLPIAFVLFILCDTVIGLQVASGGYLPIPDGSWLHRLLFMDFNLSWFFYLPSQVLIALSTVFTGRSGPFRDPSE